MRCFSPMRSEVEDLRKLKTEEEVIKVLVEFARAKGLKVEFV